MEIAPLEVPGAWRVTPRRHEDDRGSFCEWYRLDALAEVVGHPLHLAQANCSVSRRGVVRGLHFADVPPGQAKYVSCPSGAVLDVVVDLRVGSPTFGAWDAVRLDDVDRRAVYVPEGLGHAFCALSEGATVVYLCSEPYAPGREHAVHAFDKDVGVAWPEDVTPVLSPRDAEAPGLWAARDAGLLPSYEACLAYEASLSEGS